MGTPHDPEGLDPFPTELFAPPDVGGIDGKAARKGLLALLDALPIGIFWKDRDSCYLGCNAAFARDAGVADPAQIVGMFDRELAWGASWELYRADDLGVMESGEARMRHKNGSWVWVLDRGKLFARDENGAPLRVAGTHLDITERKHLEEELRVVATRDKLTGTLNRRAGLEALERELRTVDRRGTELAICYVDLDRLKETNDSQGHAAGDALIAQAAQVLGSSLRATDLLARLGGDEFLLILPDCGPEEADAIWKRIALAALESTPRVEMSHGFAFYSGGSGKSIEALVAQADSGMYADKRNRCH